MKTVADKERNHNQILCFGHPIAVTDTWIFFHENGINLRILLQAPDQFDLAFNGFARVFAVSSAMARNEKCCFMRLRHSREWMFFRDFLCTSQDHFRHALMGSNRAAVVYHL